MQKYKTTVGICPICHDYVLKGDEVRYRSDGRAFHTICAEKHPDDPAIEKERKLQELYEEELKNRRCALCGKKEVFIEIGRFQVLCNDCTDRVIKGLNDPGLM